MLLFFFLIVDLYFLTPVFIAEIFNPIAELITPIGILSKEVKPGIQIHPLTTEAKIRKCSM